MKTMTIKTIVTATATVALSLSMFGCSGDVMDVAKATSAFKKIHIPELTLPVTGETVEETPAEEVVEAVDPATGETVQMTVAEAQSKGATVTSTPKASSGSAQSAGSGSSGGSAPASTQSAPAQSQAPAASQSAPAPAAPAQPAQPAHTHTWITVTDVPAVAGIRCSCGTVFTGPSAQADSTAHKKERALAGDMAHSSHPESTPAVTHQECSGCGARG